MGTVASCCCARNHDNQRILLLYRQRVWCSPLDSSCRGPDYLPSGRRKVLSALSASDSESKPAATITTSELAASFLALLLTNCPARTIPILRRAARLYARPCCSRTILCGLGSSRSAR